MDNKKKCPYCKKYWSEKDNHIKKNGELAKGCYTCRNWRNIKKKNAIEKNEIENNEIEKKEFERIMVYQKTNEYIKNIPDFDEIIEKLIFIDNPNTPIEIIKNRESIQYTNMWNNIVLGIQKAIHLPIEKVENGNYLKWAVYNLKK